MIGADLAEFKLKLSNMDRDEVIAAALTLFAERVQLHTRLTETQNASTEMALQFQQMKDELNAARHEIKVLREQNQHLTGVNTIRTDELYGQSTEKAEYIFDLASDGNTVNEDPIDEDAEEDAPDSESNGGGSSGHGGGSTGRGGSGKLAGKRKRDLEGLPTCSIFEYDIDELNHEYGEGNWRFAFWQETVTVEVVRQTTYAKHTFKPIISVGLEHTLVRAGSPDLFMPKSLASESLVAQIILDKYRLFLPLYRLEHDENRFGFPLSRQTMSNWVCKACHELLLPVYEFMCEVLRTCKYQQCDETPYLVIHDGRQTGSKSYIWVHRTSELLGGPVIIVYCYEKTRKADHLRDFYRGVTMQFFLTCDAYIGYVSFAGDYVEIVILCGCFMHARRRFVEALRIVPTKGLSEEQIRSLPEARAIRLIGEIYHAEGALKNLSPEARLEQRQSVVKKKVDAFFDYVHSFDPNDPSLSEKMRDAISYSINQEECLRRFLDDGNIPLDDGATERSIRGAAQGRRSYLFSNTVRGAQATVIASTMIETAKANGADPYYYLKYLLEKMPHHLYDKDKSYLPDMMPWSDAYKLYETEQKQASVERTAPPGNSRPKTPVKKKQTSAA
ncbi:MAG: IS66 family transposase [Mogibacterium sp.]|nr:IS66 family transposase [Mogibacterium sp.]